MRTLHRYYIDGISIMVYDQTGSQSADWIASELQADHYGLRNIRFAEGDVVVDVGAHVGLFSIYLAKRSPLLRIVAFEPFPTNFRNCSENLELNGISNVTLSPSAISSDCRRLSMVSDPGNSGGASAVVTTFGSNGTESEIPSMTLDEVFSVHEIDKCKLLKIDCEGMEYEIIPSVGAFDRVEYMSGEFHASPRFQAQGWSPQRLHDYCRSLVAEDKLKICFNVIPE